MSEQKTESRESAGTGSARLWRHLHHSEEVRVCDSAAKTAFYLHKCTIEQVPCCKSGGVIGDVKEMEYRKINAERRITDKSVKGRVTRRKS